MQNFRGLERLVVFPVSFKVSRGKLDVKLMPTYFGTARSMNFWWKDRLREPQGSRCILPQSATRSLSSVVKYDSEPLRRCKIIVTFDWRGSALEFLLNLVRRWGNLTDVEGDILSLKLAGKLPPSKM